MNPLLALLLQGIFGTHQLQPLVSPIPAGGMDSYNILGEGTFGRISQYGPTGNNTATGTIPMPNRTAAVSPDILSSVPYGSLVRVGNQTYRIEDLTAPEIKNTLDVFSNSPSGLQRNIPYQIIGKDFSGLKYKVRR